ncbi:MAG: helix-turn-helix domain-containing protein [Candidatus Nanopelagicales bacterium]
MAETWADYTRRITAGATQADIAARTGIEQSSISRWRQGRNTPRAELVVAFARSYDRNPVEALIVAGYLDRNEVGGVIELETSLSVVSTDQLLDEMRRRFSDIQRRLAAVAPSDTNAWPDHWTDPASYQQPPRAEPSDGQGGASTAQ